MAKDILAKIMAKLFNIGIFDTRVSISFAQLRNFSNDTDKRYNGN